MLAKTIYTVICVPGIALLLSVLPTSVEDGLNIFENSSALTGSSTLEAPKGQDMDQAFAAGRFE